MAQDIRSNLKKHFQTGDIPTEGHYRDLLDSYHSLIDQNSGSLNLTGSVSITGSTTLGSNTFLVDAQKITLAVSGGTASPARHWIELNHNAFLITAPVYQLGDFTGSHNQMFGTPSANFKSTFHNQIFASSSISASSIMLMSNSLDSFEAMKWMGDPMESLNIGSMSDNHHRKLIRYYATSSHMFMNNTPVIIGTGGSDITNGTAQLVVMTATGGNGNLYVQKHITASGNISASKIITDEVTGIGVNGLTFTGNITASGTISASAFITNGHITASGNISSSGDIIADNFTSTGGDDNGINFTDGVNISGNITSSGNMQITGNISASKALEGRYRRAIHTIETSKALILNDEGAYIRCGPHKVTIPLNSSVAFPIGTEIDFIQTSSAGHLMVTASAGDSVTLNSRHALFSASGQFSAISCKKVATDEWDVIGDLTK